MKLMIEIDEEDYHRIASGFGQEEDALLLEKIFKNGTPIPDTDTNGNSVIKIFCKGIVRINSRKNVSVEFNKDWWNAPYQKGGKE